MKVLVLTTKKHKQQHTCITPGNYKKATRTYTFQLQQGIRQCLCVSMVGRWNLKCYTLATDVDSLKLSNYKALKTNLNRINNENTLCANVRNDVCTKSSYPYKQKTIIHIKLVLGKKILNLLHHNTYIIIIFSEKLDLQY